MRVVKWEIVENFAKKQPRARKPLETWRTTVQAASWRNIADVRNMFNSVDYTRRGNFIFNVRTNAFRLVSRIDFAAQIVRLTHALTHAECDKSDF